MREHGREGGLPDASLSREYEDLVFDGGEASGDDGDILVRAFGSGRADGLVGTPGACIAFAC